MQQENEMTYKTRQEVLRAAADWMDVCEAAGVEALCRVSGTSRPISVGAFINAPSIYEFPLGLIDGKEVWEGDTIYCDRGTPTKADRTMNFQSPESVWSLTPPKPKTVMVELSEEDAKFFASYPYAASPLAEACRKALVEAK